MKYMLADIKLQQNESLEQQEVFVTAARNMPQNCLKKQ
jgi:hypothetical protein